MTLDYLHRLREKGFVPRTLLDVGAHLGSFTRAFLEVFPDCNPTLIEPNPYCRDDLAKLGFEVLPIAASDKTGHADLFLTKEWLQSTGCSLYRENTGHFRDEVVLRHQVATRRIDDLFEGRGFDFVKIDTQGAELDVLRGGESILRRACYIVVEVSLVEYNQGGAKAELVFEQLRKMGFQCCDVTEFHRLAGIHDGNLLQMDFLFENQIRRSAAASNIDIAGLQALSQSLRAEGRINQATALLETLADLEPSNPNILEPLAQMLGASGRTLEALERLRQWKYASLDLEPLVAPIEAQLPAALEKFNRHVAAGELKAAEEYVSALIALIPQNPALLAAAAKCDLALNRASRARYYAQILLKLDAENPTAHAVLSSTQPSQAVNSIHTPSSPSNQSATAGPVEHLIRLRDIHDVISEMLCQRLDPGAVEKINALLAESRTLSIGAAEDTDLAKWEAHYRVMVDAIDMDAVLSEAPLPPNEPEIELAKSTGVSLTWPELRAAAARMGAKVIFLSAADRVYLDLYGRWYINSVLEHCDVGHIVIIQVIGGAEDLAEIAAAIGVRNNNLFYAGDRFDAGQVNTQCIDAPPKGESEKPLAHLQCMRYLSLGTFLQKLGLPIFVSDIDLILQRGVKDLLQRFRNCDVMLNRNHASKPAGSQLTANLLLISPSRNGQTFATFLRRYLEAQLAKPRVSRWIDQLSLLLALHHLMQRGQNPVIKYFDTQSDINNVIYPAYQDNPFRFLSLFHGFDLKSLAAISTREKRPARRKLDSRPRKRG